MKVNLTLNEWQCLRAAIKEQMSLYGHAHARPILSKDAIASSTAHHRRARCGSQTVASNIFDMLHAMRQQGLTHSEIAGEPDTSAASSRIGLLPTRPETGTGQH
ncbi:hypothetical protein GR216_34825 [Rhizobium leguminosarum]|nr:hypothetical protein [Rhizobium ruizarguesonis]NEJ40225.1 hypothetical protein [Rhizobium ruizarguesonis]